MNNDAGQVIYTVIVLVAIAAIAYYLRRAFLRSEIKPWPLFFVGLYNTLLLLLFLFGMFTQVTSEGFGFLPLMGLTLPWSGLLVWGFAHKDFNFFGGGLPDTFFSIFIIHNVLSAAANSYILYLLLKRGQRIRAEVEAWEQARRNR